MAGSPRPGVPSIPSIGHIAVGLAAGRFLSESLRRPAAFPIAAIALTAVSMLPDADVLAFRFGAPRFAWYAHRGITHCLLFAAAIGLLGALIARCLRLPALYVGLLAGLTCASHGLLDTLSYGGTGVALFWPFDETRYHASNRLFPAAPIGMSYFSERGLAVALAELPYFTVFLVYALWPRKRSYQRTTLDQSTSQSPGGMKCPAPENST